MHDNSSHPGLPRTPRQFNLLLVAILGVAGSTFAIGYRAPRVGDLALGITHATRRILQKGDGWIEGELDAAEEHGHHDNASARQFCQDFDVSYGTGADGCRTMPLPRSAGRHEERCGETPVEVRDAFLREDGR
jgi:hypothetical protein